MSVYCWCFARLLHSTPKFAMTVLSKCVNHLKTCKTSNVICFCRGWMHGLAVIHQRRHSLSMVIWRRDAFVTYLLPISFTLYFQKWAVGKPKNHHAVFKQLDFTSCMFARFSESVKLGAKSHGLLRRGYSSNSHNPILEWYPPINQPKGLLIQGWHYWVWRWLLSLFFRSFQWPTPVRLKGIVFARQMHSATKFAMTVLSKCVTHAGFAKVAWTLRGIPFQVGTSILRSDLWIHSFQPTNSSK